MLMLENAEEGTREPCATACRRTCADSPRTHHFPLNAVGTARKRQSKRCGSLNRVYEQPSCPSSHLPSRHGLLRTLRYLCAAHARLPTLLLFPDTPIFQPAKRARALVAAEDALTAGVHPSDAGSQIGLRRAARLGVSSLPAGI